MVAAPLLAPDDDGVIAEVVIRRVVDSLTAADMRLLHALERARRIDVETLTDLDPSQTLWLAHFGLCGVEVDFADRVYLVRRAEGKQALDAREGKPSEPRRRRRGRRSLAARV